jgi:16S rRNA (guanine966-N2)-methyltransferase
MRIVAGRFKGRALATPSSQAIRPTSDRLRETIFNILLHGLDVDDPVTGARALDVFAGTGALGLEALSRGAAQAVFMDIGTEARGLLRTNVDNFGVGGITRILRRDATKPGEVSPFEPFTLLFLDPPYGKGLGEQAVAGLMAGGWLAPGALVVLEEAAKAHISLPAPLMVLDRREAGEGQVLFARYP